MYIKIYDRNHNLIDSIEQIYDPKTIHTLNGVNKFTCSLPLGISKVNADTVNLMNHVEFYDDNHNLKFGGILVNIDYNMPNVAISCYGWAFILQKIRLKEKEYAETTYSELAQTIFEQYISGEYYNAQRYSDFAYIGQSSTDGHIATVTERKVDNKDNLWDKLVDWATDINAYVYITDDRGFYFEKTIKQNQMWYAKWEDSDINKLGLSTTFNNLLSIPSVSLSVIDMSNDVYGEVSIEKDGTTTILYKNSKDLTSINQYGLLQSYFDVNDNASVQSTVNSKVNAELSRCSYPLSSMDIAISDSILAPLDEIKVGHSITVYIEPYLEYETTTKILEIERDYTTNTAKLKVGETLFKDNAPKVINYK